jgi:hypothetical protein
MEWIFVAMVGVVAMCYLLITLFDMIMPDELHPDIARINWPAPVDPSIVVERRE